MNLDFNDEQKLIQETTRLFARTELEQISTSLDNESDRAALIANMQKLAALGYMGINIKEEYGGADAGAIAFSLAMTEIAKVCAPTAVTVSINNLVCEIIQAIGTEEQKKKYISKICSGEWSAGIFGVTGNCAEASDICATAAQEDDHYILNGSKSITYAPNACVFIVWAVTDNTVPLSQGVSCFLIEACTPGLHIDRRGGQVRPNTSMTNQLILTHCRVPQSALLGKLNQGFNTSVTQLAGGRIGIGSLGLGIGLAAMMKATWYANERSKYDQSQTFQTMLEHLDASHAELEAARFLLMNAAYHKEQGRPFAKVAAMARMYAVKSANLACKNALQMLERYGFTKDTSNKPPVRTPTINADDDEIQRLIVSWDILQGLAV